MKRLIVAAFAITQLSGCFFFYAIPGSFVDRLNGEKGDFCVARGTQVGDRISLPDGRVMTVASLSGMSYKCSALGGKPIRADLTPPA